MTATHGAYNALRLAKEGKLPSARTREGKAVRAIERKIHEHFQQLNPLQEIELFHLLPLTCFLMRHPMTTDAGTLAADFKWAWSRVEQGLKVLVDLGNSSAPSKAPRVSARDLREG